MRRLPARKHLAFLVILAAALAPVSGSAQAAEQSVVLDIASARALGDQALLTGNFELALRVANAFLARDPNDFDALILLAATQTALGNGLEAARTARRAHGLATNANQRYSAARQVASGNAQASRYTLAAIWLRRAAQNATSDKQNAIVRRDFNFVRAQNPWQVDLAFGATPSSNINGGSSADLVFLLGIPFVPDQPLPGYQAHVSGGFTYRIAQSKRSETRVGANGFALWNRLSDSTQAQNPGVTASDYNYSTAALTFEHKRVGAKPGQMFTYSLDLGRSWYGGQVASDFASGKIQFDTNLTDTRKLSLHVRADVQRDIDHSKPLLYVGQLGASFLTEMPNGDNLRVSATLRKSFSATAAKEFTQLQVGADYFFAKPVLGMQLSLGVGLAEKVYPVAPFSTNGRRDRRLLAQAGVTFNELGLFGFSPTATLRTERTISSLPVFSSDLTSLEIGFRSDF